MNSRVLRYGFFIAIFLCLLPVCRSFAQLPFYPERYHRALSWQARGWHTSAAQVFDSLLAKRNEIEYLRGSVLSYLALGEFDSVQHRLAAYEMKKLPAYSLLKAEVGCYTGNYAEGIAHLGQYLAARYKLSEQELMRDTLLQPCQNRKSWDSLWTQQWYTPEQQTLNHLEYLAYKGDWHLLLEELDAQYARLAKRHEYAFLRAQALEGIHDLKSALLAAEIATNQRPRELRYVILRARLMLALGYKRQAEALLIDLQKRDKYNPAFFPPLAWTQYEIGRHAVAYTTAQRYLEYYPQDTAMLRCAALAASAAKMYSQSLNMLARLFPLASDNTRVCLQRLRAEMLTAQGDYRQALEDYKDALTRRPQDTTLLRQTAQVYFQLRDTVEGCKLLNRAQTVGHLRVDLMLIRYCKK